MTQTTPATAATTNRTAADPMAADLLERATDIVARARVAGADAAEVVVDLGRATSVNVRLGALEDVTRSEDRGLALRLFIGQRSASVSTSDFAPTTLTALIERAVEMARLAPEDPYAGLAPADLLLRGPIPDLDLADPAEPEPEALRLRALATEDAARAVAGVTNSDGGSAGYSHAIHAMANSNGFAAAYAASGHNISASVIAGEGDRMQRDHDWHGARHIGDLEDPEQVGRRAAERAVERLDPQTVPGGRMPILFDPRVAGGLMGHLIAAMGGPMIARGTSYLLAHEGAALFPVDLFIDDDPLRLRGTKSRPFDAEGLATHRRAIVSGGVIGDWLLDSASARKLGRAPTGHANGGGVGTGNLTLRPGTISRAALMADITDGLLITEVMGQGVDYVTGDYSRAASGFRIVNGEVAGPVSGITIAGNLLGIFADLRAADDLHTRFANHVPTLRTDSLTVAGG